MIDTVMPLIQTSLIAGLGSENRLIHTISTMIIVICIKKIVDNFSKIRKYILKKIMRDNKKSEYLIQGTVAVSHYYHDTRFPDEYKAIMFKLNKLKIDIRKGKQFNFSNSWHKKSKLNSLAFSYSLNTTKSIKINNDIYLKQTNDRNDSDDRKTSMEYYNLTVFSYTLNFDQLKKIIDKWVIEYKNYIKEHDDGNIYFFSYINGGDEKKKEKINFESHIFYSTKSFDNIFFTDKIKLIDRIDYFVNNEDNYKKLGIPYTLGLLFHGKPGCGKTSTIKALAKYTDRHIVEIPLSKIKTCSELKKIFFNNIINDHYVPPHKKIIVLEDIDCMSDIVSKRNSDESNIETLTKSVPKMLNTKSIHRTRIQRANKHVVSTTEKAISPFDDDSDNLTLSFILNLIDGVLEQRGRIMIITTNHPDKLDDALLRPGRIDMKIDFTKCSSKMCVDILNFYYDNSIDAKFQNYKWTPAEVFQFCFNNSNINDTVKLLNS